MGETHAAPHTPHIDEAWTPARGVRAAERTLGRAELVDWCVGLLTGDIDGADPDTPSLRWIGGGAAGDGRNRTYWEHENHAYWPRVWAARALRYVWEPWAARAVIRGLDDPAWRVREHCCALVRVRELADAADRVAELAEGADRCRQGAGRGG